MGKEVGKTAAAQAVFSGEKERDRKVRGMVVILAVLALLALVLALVLWGVIRTETALAQAADQPMTVVVNPSIFIDQPPAAICAEAALPMAAAVVEIAGCPEGLSLIPGWSDGICGDEGFLALAADQPKGEIQGPGSGTLVILSAYEDAHCYGDGAAFWPLDLGVYGSIAVPCDQLVTVSVADASRWGLGGAPACQFQLEAVEMTFAGCPEGLSLIPGWSDGICGDEGFLALAADQPKGEIQGSGSGTLLILSEYESEHCYGDEAVFWPLTLGVNGSIPVPRDQRVTVEVPEGTRWGLGGATECTP